MKGIILAGGAGTRLYPMTAVLCKQLLPVYDKPMIYYPLSTLMLAGIREVLVISTPHDTPRFEQLLGDGRQWGLEISYTVQPSPDGLAQAFILGAPFVGTSPCALVLGDNISYGHGLSQSLQAAAKTTQGGTNDNEVVGIARSIRPSARGELEITDVNRAYLERGQLKVIMMGRGSAWLDTGTPESLLQASLFIETLEQRQGLKVACPEEIAWRMGWIDSEALYALAQPLKQSSYGRYLVDLLDGRWPDPGAVHAIA